MDAYIKPTVEADLTTGKQLREQAKTIGSLKDFIADAVPQAIDTMAEQGREDAFKAWQLRTPELEKQYRKDVKNNSIFASASPFFNAGLERMMAVQDAEEYQLSFGAKLKEARQEEGTSFDFSKFSREHMHEFQTSRGITEYSQPSYLTFAKGVQNVHNAAIAEEADVRERQVLQKADDAFGSVIRSFAQVATESSAVGMNAAIKKFYTDTGRNPQDALAIIKQEMGHLYSQAFVAEDGDPERFIKVMGGITTGRKGENGKMVTFSEDVGAFAIWSNGARANGASIAHQRLTQMGILYEQQKAKTFRTYRENQAKNPNWIQTDEGRAFYNEHVKQFEGDGDKSTDYFYQTVTNELNGTSMTTDEYNLAIRYIEANGLNNAEGQDYLVERRATAAQLHTYDGRKQLRRDTVISVPEFKTHDDARTVFREDASSTLSGRLLPPPHHKIPQQVRWNITDKHEDILQDTISSILSNPDIDNAERRNQVKVASVKYVEDVQNEFDAIVDEANAKQEAIKLSKEQKDTLDRKMSEEGADVSMVFADNQHVVQARDMISTWSRTKEAKGGAEMPTDLRRKLYGLLKKKGGKLRTISDMFDIPMTDANMPTLVAKMAQVESYVNERLIASGANGLPKREPLVIEAEESLRRVTTEAPKVVQEAPEEAPEVIRDAKPKFTNSTEASEPTPIAEPTYDVATIYNGGTDAQLATYRERLETAKNAKLNSTQKKNVEGLEHLMAGTGRKVFAREANAVKGFDWEQATVDMRNIYGVESSFGVAKDLANPSGATGVMQVKVSTFQDLIKNGVLGAEYAYAADLDLGQLHNISDKDAKWILSSNNRANMLAALGKYVSTRQHIQDQKEKIDE
jgi:hypothetical protein